MAIIPSKVLCSNHHPASSFEDNSPRTRTSKSGLPEDAEVVPPSPRGPDPHGGHSLPRESHQRLRGNARRTCSLLPPPLPTTCISSPFTSAKMISCSPDPAEDFVRARRRNPSAGARGADLETLKRVSYRSTGFMQISSKSNYAEVWWQPIEHHCWRPPGKEPRGAGVDPDLVEKTSHLDHGDSGHVQGRVGQHEEDRR